MLNLKNTTRSLFDSGYRQDRQIALNLGNTDITPEQYEKLKEAGPLSEKFSQGIVMAEYTHSGVFGAGDDPEERLKIDVQDYIETYAGMHVDG